MQLIRHFVDDTATLLRIRARQMRIAARGAKTSHARAMLLSLAITYEEDAVRYDAVYAQIRGSSAEDSKDAHD